ncbi:MAG: hypothetical protein Phyf2KO_07860 [Phycisphaerales bacterium]
MPEKQLLIHIGLHKTGTTWLQRRVFADAEMGFLSTKNGQSNEATDAFVTVDPLAFDPAQARAAFEPMIHEAGERGLVPVISQERLSSDPSFGGYYFTDVIDRLIETFDDFRVLLTIREQQGMLLALYRQAIRSGGTYSLTQMIGTGEEPVGWKPTIRPEYLMYDRMIEHLRTKLGDERVCVLPLELMRSDPQNYMRRLLAFTGAETSKEPGMEAENAGLSPLATRLSTLTNRFSRPNPLGPDQSWRLKFMRRFYWWFDRIVPKGWSNGTTNHWKSTIERRVGEMYDASNRRTSELTGFNLGSMGYSVGQGLD